MKLESRLTAALASLVLIAGCGSTSTETSSVSAILASAELPHSVPSGTQCTGASQHHDFVHPSWGAVRLFVRTADEQPAPCFTVVDTSGAIKHTYMDKMGRMMERFELATPRTDSTGNIFLAYNPGRYDGIIVLVPNKDGFLSFEPTIQTGPRRFYNAWLDKPDNAGRIAILTRGSDCDPSCAAGTTSVKQWEWNGSDYVMT